MGIKIEGGNNDQKSFGEKYTSNLQQAFAHIKDGIPVQITVDEEGNETVTTYPEIADDVKPPVDKE